MPNPLNQLSYSRLRHLSSGIYFPLCFGLSLLAFSLGAHAQDSQSRVKQLIAMDLGELLNINIATGTPKELAEAPAVVSVITEEDIKATGARTLAEALDSVPGLYVSTARFRLQKVFSVRGIQTDLTPQTLVLLDGNKISQLSQGSTPASFRYPVHAIERIEVIRGPGSAVYGADAFSGVINVITKKSKDIEKSQVGVTLGSFNTSEVSLTATQSFREVDVSLLADLETSDGDDGMLTRYGSLKTDRTVHNLHLNAEGQNWALTNWYYRIETFSGNGSGIYANDYDFDTTYAWNSKLDYQKAFDNGVSVNMDFSISQLKLDAAFRLFPEGTWPVGVDGNLLIPPFLPVSFPEGVIGRPGSKQTRRTVNIVSTFSPSERHRLRLAAGGISANVTAFEVKNFGPGVLDGENYAPISTDLVDVTGTPFVYLPPFKRDLWHLSLQDEWKISEVLELTAGIRYDHYSDVGSTTNPRMALVWKANNKLTTKLLYGSAFRVPTAMERTAQNNPANLGNPDIRPEQIETVETVVDYQFSDTLTGTLNLYRYEADDLIILDQFATNQNLGRQEGKGAEMEVQWHPHEQLQVKAHLALQSAQDTLSDTDKAFVPARMAYLDVRYRFATEWQLSVQNYWVGDRKREQGDARERVGNFFETDINLIYQPSPQWQAQFQIKNLFDRDNRYPTPNSPLFGLSGLGTLLGLNIPDLGFPGDTPIEGRAIYGTLEYSF